MTLLDILNIIILFGGVQAISLCLFLSFKKSDNKAATRYFILFLFCLAYYNITYAAIFEGLKLGEVAVGAFPLPYKYVIGPALYLYVLRTLRTERNSRGIWLLFTPAILYGLLRIYWLKLIIAGENSLIIREVYDTGFFTYNEIGYLLFNGFLSLSLLRKLQAIQEKELPFGKKKHWRWLKSLTYVFLGYTLIHLLLIGMSYALVGTHSRVFYYPTLIINSLFIYWIGFVGYTKAHLLFTPPLFSKKPEHQHETQMNALLEKAMKTDAMFKNPKLTAQELATHLGVSTNELSKHINHSHGGNFSQYVNQYRTEEAIRLMQSELSSKYTLEAIAEEAGFNSRSSFFKVFKEKTGKTPSAYLKDLS